MKGDEPIATILQSESVSKGRER